MNRACERWAILLPVAAALGCADPPEPHTRPASEQVVTSDPVPPEAEVPRFAPHRVATDGTVVCWIDELRLGCAGAYADAVLRELATRDVVGVEAEHGSVCTWDAEGATQCAQFRGWLDTTGVRRFEVARGTRVELGFSTVCVDDTRRGTLWCRPLDETAVDPSEYALDGTAGLTDFDVGVSTTCVIEHG